MNLPNYIQYAKQFKGNLAFKDINFSSIWEMKMSMCYPICLDGKEVNRKRNISINTLSFRSVVSENGR